MSKPVELADVADRLDEFGPVAILVTVGPDGRPHVVTVVVDHDERTIRTSVGATTRRNATERPAVTLAWYPAPGGEYVLLLDGTAAPSGDSDDRGAGAIEIVVDHGILHRLAGTGDGPSCVAIADGT